MLELQSRQLQSRPGSSFVYLDNGTLSPVCWTCEWKQTQFCNADVESFHPMLEFQICRLPCAPCGCRA